MRGQVHRFQRKVYPAFPQANSAVPRPQQQIFTEQPPEVSQDCRVARRMEAVASVIDTHAFQIEACGVSTHARLLLQNCDPR
jgi:hypothetical protein